MNLGKFFLAIIISALLGVVYFLFIREPASPYAGLPGLAQGNEGRSNVTPANTRRGDDPGYADEVRINSALTRETQEKQAALERELSLAREQNLNANTALQEKIGELTKSITEMQEASAKAGEQGKAAAKAEMEGQLKELKDNIAQLTRANQENQAANEARIAQLTQELAISQAAATTAGGETSPVETKPALPDVYGSGAITLPYSFGGTTTVMSSITPQTTQGNGDILNSAKDYLNQTFGGLSNPVPEPRQATQARPMPQPGQPQQPSDGWPTVFPVYTLPPSTILSDALLVTPIIGRVPLQRDSRIEDPFFFKVEIGGKNLAANGHQIPGVAKMIASGYATGVREQSCVRGYIDSLTFIFIDGRIVTQGKSSGEGSSSGETLGYLSDPWGKPCLSGRYISNAGDYLKSRAMAAFVEASADALSQSQISYRRDSDGNYSAMLDGSIYPYIFGRGISGTAKEVADYIRERTASAFDVVYVEQGKPVQIMINEMINIDYDAKARKVNYYREPRITRHHYD